jgi:hypothetical protein
MKLNRDFHEFLRSFAVHEVRYLVVGGYALAAHGHPRYTKDLDVWVWTESENAKRIVRALEAFGFSGLGLTEDDFSAPDVIVQLGREPQRIDIMTFASGLSFPSAYENRFIVRIDDVDVPFLSVEDLRTNKRATGRLRDEADAAELSPED